MYGKVRNVTKLVDSKTIVTSYLYDAQGNRILKRILEDGVEQKATAHTRNASGNVMQAAITKIDTTEYEYPLYGSSRLGMYRGGTSKLHRMLRNKHYELSNHLGNVLAVVSDARLGEDSTNNGQYDYYLPHIVSLSDYYPFGLGMKGREYKSSEYRYGFNGKENDKDFGNKQIIQDYGFRLYNPSIAKFLSVDPLSPSYPWYTPYQFAGNKVIEAIDLDGLEEKKVNDKEVEENGEEYEKPTQEHTIFGLDRRWLSDQVSIPASNPTGILIGADFRAFTFIGYFNNGTLSRKLVTHYSYGKGRPLYLTKEDMLKVYPYYEVKKGTKDEIVDVHLGLTDIEFYQYSQGLKPGESKEITPKVKGVYAAQSSTLGNFTTTLSGTVTMGADNIPVFEGQLSYYDEYDFYLSFHRPIGPNLKVLTAIMLLPGSDYVVRGSMDVQQKKGEPLKTPSLKYPDHMIDPRANVIMRYADKRNGG